jgi:hypothetical protein
MKAYRHREKVAHGLVMLVTGVCLVLRAGSASPGEGQSGSASQTLTDSGASSPRQAAGTTAGAPRGASGILIHIDPQTGALVSEPPRGTVPPALTAVERNAFSTSDQGLVETPNSVPHGGVTLDLQGRFRSPLFATIDDAGGVEIQHLHEMPGASDKK